LKEEIMSKSEDEKFDEAVASVRFLRSVGLDPMGSVAVQLAEVRWLVSKLRDHEGKLEQWARSGDFVLAVPGENVSAVVNPDGSVLVVHSSEKSDG
jgi:hypothetical protein